MMELGGNIKLDGFHDVDPSTLIIVKKIVGNYARRMQEETTLKELLLQRIPTPTNILINAKLITHTSNCDASASDVNLFFAINTALATVFSKAKGEIQQQGL